MKDRLLLLAQEHQTLVGLLKCPICLEMMINPVRTKCGHRFCNHCMDLALTQIGQRGRVACPACKVPGVTKRSLEMDPVFAQIVNQTR